MSKFDKYTQQAKSVVTINSLISENISNFNNAKYTKFSTIRRTKIETKYFKYKSLFQIKKI